MSAHANPRRLATFAAGALSAFALLAMPGGTATARASGGLEGSACVLLNDSEAQFVVYKTPPYLCHPFGPNGSQMGQCWERVTDPNDPDQTICHYGRSAFLTLERHASAKQASHVVRRALDKGYQRLRTVAGSPRQKIKAFAGIAYDSTGGAVIMAVRRTVVLYAEGASSDDDPSPSYPEPKHNLSLGAHEIARALHRPGCPQHPRACSL